MIVAVRRGFNQSSVPLVTWLRDAYQPLLHLLTQKRWLECDNDTRMRWLQHFLLVTGYATMFLLVVAFLPWFQRDGPEFHWTALFGYYGTAVLLWRHRRRHAQPLAQDASRSTSSRSHRLDVPDPALPHVALRDPAAPRAAARPAAGRPTSSTSIHLMIAVPMLVIEVPFGKWLHLVFRPVAKYLVAVREAAIAKPVKATPHHALTHG